jgi:perosamine synthetase
MIPVYSPYLPKYVLKYAHEAIDSGWISSRGEYVEKTTEKLKELLNIKYLLLVNNGTCATHLVAKALSKKNNLISKLLVPNNVYVAAWNSFLSEDYKLYVLDTNLDTWNFELELSVLEEENNKNKFCKCGMAILIVHNIGNIINVPKLKEKYPNLVFVEDNCEGFLGKYNGKYSGTESLASSISFFGNKNITSGEGGAFLTNDEELYEYAVKVHGQGMTKTKFIHDELGYNYRMTNIEAALLYGQLEHLNEIIERKHKVFDTYKQYLSSVDGISFQKIEDGTEHSHWMFGIRIKGNISYNTAEKYFTKCGVEIRPMFYDIGYHRHINFENCGRAKNGLIINDEVIILPSYPELTNNEIIYITDCVKNYVEGIKNV